MKFQIGDTVIFSDAFMKKHKDFRFKGRRYSIVGMKEKDGRYLYHLDNALGDYGSSDLAFPKDTIYVEVEGRKVTATDFLNTGTARCNPADSFNLSTGVSLAVERMKFPHKGAKYFYISDSGEVEEDTFGGYPIDKRRESFGNVFETEIAAQFARSRVKDSLARSEHK